ncbi:hypothetical protein D3C74_411470 [compost metagenome]
MCLFIGERAFRTFEQTFTNINDGVERCFQLMRSIGQKIILHLIQQEELILERANGTVSLKKSKHDKKEHQDAE